MGLRKFWPDLQISVKSVCDRSQNLVLGLFCISLSQTFIKSWSQILCTLFFIFKCVIIFPQDDKSTVFLIAAYARYSCPYVWVSVSYNHCTSDVYGALFSLNPLHSLACWVT